MDSGASSTRTRPPCGDACTALSARLNTARCSRSSSPSTTKRSFAPDADDLHVVGAIRMRGNKARGSARDSSKIQRLYPCDSHAGEVEKLRQQA